MWYFMQLVTLATKIHVDVISDCNCLFQDKYKRSLADNENILSRSRKQIDEARLFGIQTFSKDLLEVADILGKATESVPKEEIEKNISLKNLYDGLLMTEAQLQKVFNKNGLEKINPLNEKFDPYSHEALFQIPFPDKEKGTVAVVEKVGYKLHGRTLRPALVGVVKGQSFRLLYQWSQEGFQNLIKLNAADWEIKDHIAFRPVGILTNCKNVFLLYWVHVHVAMILVSLCHKLFLSRK